MRKEIQLPDQFDDVVFGFVMAEEHDKRIKLWQETHGYGCGCPQCRKAAPFNYLDAADRLDWFAEKEKGTKKNQ